MAERTSWFDPDEWPDALGVMLHGNKARLAGAELCLSPTRDREAALMRSLAENVVEQGTHEDLMAEKGFYFLYEDEKTVFPFYALPRLYVFARDAEGFYAADEPVDMDSGATIWHVGAEGQVTRAAANLRALIEAILSDEVPRWETDHTHALFASQEAAEDAGELFLRNRTPWRRPGR